MVTFKTVISHVQIQKFRKAKMANLIRSIFSVKTRRKPQVKRVRERPGKKRGQERAESAGVAVVKTEETRRSVSNPLIKCTRPLSNISEERVILLESKIQALLKERAQIERKNKRKQMRMIEDIMNEKIYADSLRDITVQLENKLTATEGKMRTILEENGLNADALLEQKDFAEEGLEMGLSGKSKVESVVSSEEVHSNKTFEFNKAFTVKIGGQEFDEEQSKPGEEQINLKQEEKEILKYKAKIDTNKSLLANLSDQHKEMESNIKRLEARLKDSGQGGLEQLRQTKASEMSKMEKYEQRIIKLENLNCDLMEEIKLKRKAVDEYTSAKKKEMKGLKEKLYKEYLYAKERMDDERKENQAIVGRFQEEIQDKNLQMVEMMGKFKKVKEISDQLKQHYLTLKQNGFEIGSIQDFDDSIEMGNNQEGRLKSLNKRVANYRKTIAKLKRYIKANERKRLEIRKKFIEVAFKLDKMNAKGLALIRENIMLIKKTDGLKFEIRVLEENLKKQTGVRTGEVDKDEVEKLKCEKQELQQSLDVTMEEKCRVTLEIEDVRKKLKELRIQMLREDELVQEEVSKSELIDEDESSLRLEEASKEEDKPEDACKSNILFLSFKEKESWIEEQVLGNGKQEDQLLVEFDKEFESLLMSIKEKNDKIVELRENMQVRAKQSELLQQKLQGMEEELARKGVKQQEMESRLEILEEENKDLEQQLERIETEKEEMESQVDNSMMTIRKMTFEKNKLDFKIKEGESRLSRLEKEKDALREKLKDAEQRKTSEVNRLQSQVQAQEKELAEQGAALAKEEQTSQQFKKEKGWLEARVGRQQVQQERQGRNNRKVAEEDYLERVYQRSVIEGLNMQMRKFATFQTEFGNWHEHKLSLKMQIKVLKNKLLNKIEVITLKERNIQAQKRRIYDLHSSSEKLATRQKIMDLDHQQFSSKASYLGKKAKKTRLRILEEGVIKYKSKVLSLGLKFGDLQSFMASKVEGLTQRLAILARKMAEITKLEMTTRTRPSNENLFKELRDQKRQVETVKTQFKDSFVKILEEFTKGKVKFESDTLYQDFSLYFEENMFSKIQNLTQKSLSEKIDKLNFEEKIIFMEAEKAHLIFTVKSSQEKIENLKSQYSNIKKAYQKVKHKMKEQAKPPAPVQKVHKEESRPSTKVSQDILNKTGKSKAKKRNTKHKATNSSFKIKLKTKK